MPSWIEDLLHRRGARDSIRELVIMSRYHGATKQGLFHSLERIMKAAEKHNASFTFPSVALVVYRNSRLFKNVVQRGHELASHGLIHTRFDRLAPSDQERQLRDSAQILSEIVEGVVLGVRTPYELHTDESFTAMARTGYLYDSSIYHPTPTTPYKIGGDPDLIEIPWTLSDPGLIDREQLSPSSLYRFWRGTFDLCAEGEVVTLNAHPVRIGTQKYLAVLECLLTMAFDRGFWLANLSEVAEKFKERKINTPVFALSGDIDCVAMSDYLLRILKKA